MAIYFKTNDPQGLLLSLKKAINEKRIVTWSVDEEGDFTHDVDQWRNLAWLRPEVQTDRLAFYIIKQNIRNITKQVYAVYHGRFAESLLAHFDSKFSNATATSLPEGRDIVS